MSIYKSGIAMVLLLGACEPFPESGIQPLLVESGPLSTRPTPISTPALSNAQPRPGRAAEIAFIKAQLDALQPRSIAENREYCGYLGVTHAGEFAISPAKRGDESGCTPDDPPPGLQPLASYHTHAAFASTYDSEVPSSNDLEGDIAERVNGYVSTPGGRLWFNDAAAGRAILLCGLGCVVADPRFEPDPAWPVRQSYTLAELRTRQN